MDPDSCIPIDAKRTHLVAWLAADASFNIGILSSDFNNLVLFFDPSVA
jgi:hypothetical protein